MVSARSALLSWDDAEHVGANAAFARDLEETLTSANVELSLSTDLRKEVDKAILINHAAAASKRADLDRQGTRLWNLASKLKSQKFADEELLCLGNAAQIVSKYITYQRSSCICLPSP